MAHRPTKKQLERKLSALRAGLPSPEVRAFVEKCHGWLETNKDNRGTTAEAIKDGFHCCVRLQQALRTARSHEDSSVRRMAEKTVKAVLHDRFPEIRERLRALNGQVSKVGKQKAEKRRQGSARTIGLDEQFELRELRSVTSLQRVGRTLGNCVAKQSHAKDYLRDADTEMWAVYERADQRPLYLLQVDRSTKEIDEFEGHDDGASTPKLKRTLAFGVLRALDVTANDEEAFVRVGAFSAFADGQPAVESIEVGESLHWVWVLRDGAEIIIATKPRPGKRRRWSRFVRHSAQTVSRRRRRCRQGGLIAGHWNHLSEGELALLVVDHPAFAERLRDDAIDGRLKRDSLLDTTESR